MELEHITNASTEKINKDKNVRLTKKDTDILFYILRFEWADTESVRIKFFNKYVTAYNRLKLLVDGGYLKTCETFLLPSFIYFVTKKGYRVLTEAGYSTMNRPTWDSRTYRESTFEHRRRIVEAMALIEKYYTVKSYKNDIEVKRKEAVKYGDSSLFQSHIVDLALTMGDGRWVAVEVETSIKDKKRYREIFQQLKNSNLYVLYVCTSQEMINSIKSNCEYGRVGFVTYQEFKKDPVASACFVRDKNGKTSELKSNDVFGKSNLINNGVKNEQT